MIRRSIVALAASLVLVAVPAIAKDKQPVAPAPVQLSAWINPDPAVEPENILALDLSNGGRVLIRMMPAWAPGHVARVKALVGEGFYNGIVFHRVIDGFMAQTGDPTGTGAGGSQLPDLKAEFNQMPHVRGTVAMARTDQPDTANSQFFVVFMPRFALDRRYTNFGRVIAGMDAVDTIVRGEPPANPTKIVQASLLSQNLPRPAAPAPAALLTITPDMLSGSKSN